jgi:hypothetical protein
MSGSDLLYVFPEMKLLRLNISKTELNVLSPNFHIHVSVSDYVYIPRIGLPTLLQANRQTDPGNNLNRSKIQECSK